MTPGISHGCDHEIGGAVDHFRMVREIRSAIDKAAQPDTADHSGEITADVDPKAMARFLNNTLQGLVVLGKASTGKAVLRDVVQVTLSKLN